MEKKKILVCSGTGCISSKSEELLKEIKKEIKNKKLNIACEKTGCFGFCAKGPIVVVEPEEIFYELVKKEDAKDIVEATEKKKSVERLLPKENDKFIKKWHELNFYKKQKRVALRHSGKINPENIDEYILHDGFIGLKNALSKSPKDVINEVNLSGIRGRGGAGFSTGKKWLTAFEQDSEQKYICCNADEGDPGAFMDRSILEGDPYAILEGMMIAGYAIGANKGYIYVRAEYPIAVERLNIAIKESLKRGYLGKNILGSKFSFDIELRLGAGAFVCGEETALLNSVEGKRGEPRLKPPYPAISGLYSKPTVINNVETLAAIPIILEKGGAWYKKIGTKTSTGTKVFALSGNISNVGLVEVEMGTPLRTVIEDIGGGIPNKKRFKAAQLGGPSGGCIPNEHIDIPLDYDALGTIGAMMGSGGLIVMDETKCMVDIAKFFLEFTVDESCGKCTPCRLGTKRMLEILTRITEGKGKEGDIEELEELANMIKKTSLCGLGQSAPNPVLSTIKYFRDEYEAHIKEKRCPTGTCKNLTNYTIDKDKCKRCGICFKNCPVKAIKEIEDTTNKTNKAYVINKEECIKCGLCYNKCPFKAIEK